MRLSFLGFLASFMISGDFLAVGDPLWTNPLVEQRADASIHHHSDGYYYFTAIVPSWDYIELRRATTLEGLRTAELKTLWKKHATGPASSTQTP
jgi:GH43 family beta-xylosidase